MSYPVTQLTTVTIPNGSLTAANYNSEFQNVYANVGKPENIDDFSENVTEMQLDADPGELGSESQATSLSGELERIRFAIKETKQKIDPTVAHWYQTPGTLNLGGVANTDTFTIYAQNDAFTETVLTLKSDTIAGAGHKFLECISDANGTPSTRVTIDGLGNVVTLGTITTSGLTTILDTPGLKADKLILAEAGTGVNHITLQGPDSASTTTHVITLPGALPGTDAFMLINATGQISYSISSVAADNVGIAMTSIGADAIAATMKTSGSMTLTPIGSILPFYDFNGALTFNATYWAYCNGATTTVEGIGSQTLPDLSGRYLVGFGTDAGGNIGSAAWDTAAVGAAGHTLNLAHTHTGDSHNHKWYDYNSGSNHTDGTGQMIIGFTVSQQGLAQSGGATTKPAYDLFTGYPINGGNTGSALSSTQSIQPRSIRVRYLMRIK